MFNKVVIANRGVAAARLVKALRDLKVPSVALYSEADQDLPYVSQADESRLIGPGPAPQSYLNQEAIIKAALEVKADAIHPGYGFLAENAEFAEKVRAAGLTFIGPDPKWLNLMGDKTSSKELMAREGLPVSPSTGILTGTLEEKVAAASALGFPLLIKPAGGGGGIGMTPVMSAENLAAAIESAEKLAMRSFAVPSLYAEKLLTNPRHVEFQIVADQKGQTLHLFERDCSVQRRRQKVLEEAGAPNIPAAELKLMSEKAAAVMAKIGYDHLGTLETLYSPESGFSFLEVNPRLQVEHGVTEEVTGLDLAVSQIRLAAGESLAEVLPKVPTEVCGHAIEARIYAEDPLKFFPSPGPLKVFRVPKADGLRVETGFKEGATVTPFYDPMVALVIARGETRDKALDLMHEALGEFVVEGIKTNIDFIRGMLNFPAFRQGNVHTGLTEEYLASLK